MDWQIFVPIQIAAVHPSLSLVAKARKYMYFVKTKTKIMRYLPRIIALLLFVHAAHTSNAQNAFFDARRIAAYTAAGKQDSILPILLNYCPEGKTFPWERLLSKYPDHVKRLEQHTIKNNSLKILGMLSHRDSMQQLLAGKSSPAADSLQVALNRFYAEQDHLEDLIQLNSEMQNYPDEGDYLEWLRTNTGFTALFGSEKLSMLVDSIAGPGTDTLQAVQTPEPRKKLQEATKTYATQKTMLAEENLNQQIKAINTLALNPEIFQLFFPTNRVAFNPEGEKMLINGMASEKNVQEQALSAVASRSAASFSMPSQAEMIDAMAIYLAKRVKQEVSIAFIEKLGHYLQEQPILTTLFPSTLQLLNNRDAFAKPRFGTAWQIALSEDFLNIPGNLPKCLPPKYAFAQNYLLDAIQIGQIVQQKYSFTEGVNRLYNEGLLKSEALNYSNTMLYILNREFYDLQDNERYWISGQALQQMKRDELEWLYILLDIRYGESINKMMNKGWIGKQVWNQEYFTKKVYPFRNWVSRILVQLNHFESDLKQATLNSGNNLGEKLAGYWKFQNNLMDVVIDTNFIRLPKEAHVYIDYTRSIFTLYSAIDSRNYPLLVDEILKIFTRLGLDKEVLIQDVLFNRQFASALKAGDPQVQEDAMILLDSMNVHYDKLQKATQLQDMTMQYRMLLRKLRDRDKVSSLNHNMSMAEFQQFITQKLLKKQPVDWAAELFTPVFRDELVNNAGRNKDISTLLDSLNSQFNSMASLASEIELGMKAFTKLNSLLRDSKLDGSEYRRIRSGDLEHFVKEKMLSFDAPFYHPFLNRVENRAQYKKILTTLSFLSDVMKSGNSHELSEVIEAYSLPPSSYRIKRNNRFSVNIDALAGAYAGVELLRKNTGLTNASAVAGLSAPIGISLNWGKRGKAGKTYDLKDNEAGFMNRHGDFRVLTGYNFSLMATVVDIGAVVSYRITDKADGGLPADAKWSQFFSPGIMGILGLRGLPLCVATGVRFTPKLRELNAGMQANALRFDLGLYFDLPLVNVWYR